MKKITLLLILFAFTTFGHAQYLSEGFETSIPPSGWTLSSTNSGTYTWSLATVNPHSGIYSAQVQYDPALSPQNESLTSPIIDLTSATDPQLTFWFNMSYYWSVDPYPNYDFIVSITDGTTTTSLWDHTDYGVFTNFTWYEVSLDLSAYAGTNNRQLIFSYVGVDGASLDIDDILVNEAPIPPSNDDVCNATPLSIGAASSGGAYTNVAATIQPSEVGGACWFLDNPPSNSVWFSFVAPTSGEINISTIYFDGTLNDTQIALYSLTDCSDLATLTQLACDEDDDGTLIEDGILEAYLRYTELTGGQTYYIQVDGYASDVGTFDISVTDATLSIDDVSQNQFTYFPNPVKNTLSLRAQSNIQNVSVFNMLGQEVLRTAPDTIHSTVDMTALQTGAYFVKVTINDSTETVRVIKQ